MSQLSKREHMKILLDGDNHTPNEIRDIVGLTVKTVYTLIKRLRSSTSLQHKIGAGRPGILIPKIQRFVVKVVSLSPAISLCDLTHKCLVMVGMDTVSRCLKGLYYSKPYPKSSHAF